MQRNAITRRIHLQGTWTAGGWARFGRFQSRSNFNVDVSAMPYMYVRSMAMWPSCTHASHAMPCHAISCQSINAHAMLSSFLFRGGRLPKNRHPVCFLPGLRGVMVGGRCHSLLSACMYWGQGLAPASMILLYRRRRAETPLPALGLHNDCFSLSSQVCDTHTSKPASCCGIGFCDVLLWCWH